MPRAHKSAKPPAPPPPPESAGESEIIEPDLVPEMLADADLPESPVAKSRALAPRRSPGPLAVSDPLARYMADVSRHPLLTPEEEHALAERYVKTGDVQAAFRLVTANLRLVVKIAYDYRRAAFNILDLVQEGNVGLMQAVRKFDPYRGVKLSTYAAWWIRAYILRYLMENWRLVKLGTTQAQRKLFFNLKKERQRLASLGIEPETKMLADRLDVSEEDVQEMEQRLGNEEVALDAPLSPDSKSTGEDRLAHGGMGAEESLGEEELRRVFREKLAQFAQKLDEKERYIFEQRLTADAPLTLQEIGDHYKVSRERARQLEAKLIDRLREYVRKELPDFADLEIRKV